MDLNISAMDAAYSAALALRGVSLTAKTGAVTSVLGRTRVGKTTLLKFILGAEQPWT